MAYEIFIEPELQDLQDADNATEWQLICEDLGLKGQLNLSEKSPESKAPPYMAIDPKTARIIRVLCPLKTKIADYRQATIPLEVLKEVHNAQQHGWFKSIYVFSDDKTPDPFVVGFLHSEYEWNAPAMLIARWGAEMIPFELLESKAIERLRNYAKDALIEMKSYVENAGQSIDSFIHKCLGGKELPRIDFNTPDLHGSSSNLPF